MDEINQGTKSEPIKVIGLSEFKVVDGRHYKRKRGTTEWILVEAPLSAFENPLILSLVRESQAEGEPKHWLLYVARENGPGLAYQVTGDAEYMAYIAPEAEADVTISPDYLDLFQLATVTEAQAQVIADVAGREPPPYAPNRKSVTENCQGWAVRVISRLVDREIVENGKLESIKPLVEKINV